MTVYLLPEWILFAISHVTLSMPQPHVGWFIQFLLNTMTSSHFLHKEVHKCMIPRVWTWFIMHKFRQYHKVIIVRNLIQYILYVIQCSGILFLFHHWLRLSRQNFKTQQWPSAWGHSCSINVRENWRIFEIILNEPALSYDLIFLNRQET